MIYLVSNQQTLFGLEGIENISVEKSKEIMKSWKMVQFDTETTGLDPHIDTCLLAQFGSIEMIQYDLEMRKAIELLKELNK